MNIEPLEARIAPAGFNFTYTDVDGDEVTVTFSQGTRADLLEDKIDAGPFANGKQLRVLDLQSNPVFTGANISITAEPQHADADGSLDGDGRVNVGWLKTGNTNAFLDLGTVTIAGDLGKISAGDFSIGNTALAVKSLSVGSLGLFGLTTGAPNLESELLGHSGTVKIAGDLAAGAHLTANVVDQSMSIGGSVAGTLTSSGPKLTVAGDVTGRIGDFGFRLVQIGGSVIGGVAEDSGSIALAKSVITIGGDVRGGAGKNSGVIISSQGEGGPVTVNGSLVGGGGIGSGRIFSLGGFESVTILGDVRGGAGAHSGSLGRDVAAAIPMNVGTVTIGGSVIGGGADSGLVEVGESVVTIGRDLVGGAVGSGKINTFKLKSLTIGGSVVGGSGGGSGTVSGVTDQLTKVSIGGDVRGGLGDSSGVVGLTAVTNEVGLVAIGGSIIGGRGQGSGGGSISAPVAKLTIGGDLRGGSAASAGNPQPASGNLSVGGIGTGIIGGSIIAGSGTFNPNDNASIIVGDDIGSLTIRGSIVGSAVPGNEVRITAQGQAFVDPQSLNDVAIGKLTVGGSVVRANIIAGALNADAQIGAVVVGGDWVASNLIAGVQDGGDGFGNGNDVKVTGMFPDFKDDSDATGHLSRIGSVTIKGSAIGTPDAADAATFGIEAQHVVAISIGGVKQPLLAEPGTDIFNLRNPLSATFAGSGFGGDFSAFEITAPHGIVTPAPIVAPTPPANTFTYTDVDGDLVSVRFSRGTAADLLVDKGPAGVLGGEQLRSIDLQGRDIFKGASITITAQPQDKNGDGYLDGDGLVNVGEIKAAGVALGTVTIRGDLGAIDTGNAVAAVGLKKLAVLSLGLFGTTTGAADTASNITGALPSVAIGTELAGTLKADSFASVQITGSLTGTIAIDGGTLAKLTVGGDLRGIVQGTRIGAVTVTGSVYGDAIGRGQINSNGALGLVKIGGNFGGDFDNAGRISSGGDLAGLTIGRSLLGNGTTSATVDVLGKIAFLSIGGDLHGAGVTSATISANASIPKITIRGSLVGTGPGAATIDGETLGAVSIGRDLRGASSGATISSTGGGITSVKIGGSMAGSDQTILGAAIYAQGDIGAVKIGGSLVGGGFQESGYIEASGGLKSLTIGGSVVGGTGNNSGAVVIDGTLGTVAIGHDMRGGSLPDGGSTYSGSAYFQAQRIGAFSVGGSIVAGADESAAGDLQRNASIRVNDDIGSLTVKGSVTGTARIVGGFERVTQVVISARGHAAATGKTDVAIGKLTIGGRIEEAIIYGGYSRDLIGVNADAQIGAVTIGGDWRASYLIAGVQANGNGFGDADDAKLSGGAVTKDLADNTGAISKIASITIKGAALGSPSESDTRAFAIVAQQVGPVKIGANAIPLLPGASSDLWTDNAARPLGPTRGPLASDGFDFHVFEVA